MAARHGACFLTGMRMTHKRLALLGAHVARGVARLVDLSAARLDFVTVLMNAGPLCQRDIAAKLCCCQVVVSRMVRGLMKQGFVKREIPTADRRFRIVSLTAHGRAQFATLTRKPWHLSTQAHFDAQALGEAVWQEDWHAPLERVGLAFLAQLAQGDLEPPPRPEPPFTAIRLHLRERPYPWGLNDEDPITNDWAFTVTALEPPVHLGLEADPLSEEYQAAWHAGRPFPRSTRRLDSRVVHGGR